MSSSLIGRLRGPWRLLVKEIAAFGLIGAVSFVIELGLFNVILSQENVGPLKAKLVATIVATTFAYFGNRYLSFSHRARTSIGRETGFFFGINGIALLFSELILALFSYPLHYRDNHLVINIVNLATIALGTVFRFWAYKRFVFLHPDRVAEQIAARAVSEPESDSRLAAG
ncbi:GtrA family protein [Jatrophihabitans sp. DSM 45814]